MTFAMLSSLAFAAILGGSPVDVAPEVRDLPGFAGSGRVQVRYRLDMGGARRFTGWTYLPGDTLDTGWSATPEELPLAVDLLLDPAVAPVAYSEDLKDLDSPTCRHLLSAIFAGGEMNAYLDGRNVHGRRLTRDDLSVVRVGAVGIALHPPASGDTTRLALDDTMRLGKLVCLAQFGVAQAVAANAERAPGQTKAEVVFVIPAGDVWIDDAGWICQAITVTFGFVED